MIDFNWFFFLEPLSLEIPLLKVSKFLVTQAVVMSFLRRIFKLWRSSHSYVKRVLFSIQVQSLASLPCLIYAISNCKKHATLTSVPYTRWVLGMSLTLRSRSSWELCGVIIPACVWKIIITSIWTWLEPPIL